MDTLVAVIFLGIPAAVIAYAFWYRWLEYRSKTITHSSTRQVEQLTHEKAEMQDRIEIIEDRLAALETIATDPARRTAKEIEELR